MNAAERAIILFGSILAFGAATLGCPVVYTPGPPAANSGRPRLPGVATGVVAARPAAPSAPGTVDCTHRGSGKDYAVGPGKEYASIGAVPFEKLESGDTVRIFWRKEHYREKMMIGGVGNVAQPVRVCGVPGPHGELPVIDGENATTRRELDFPYDGHQPRGLVIIGHRHDEPYERTPSHIVLEGLEVRNGSPPFSFTDKFGKVTPYSTIAAGIFVERAAHLTIRGCVVTENNNGIFIGTGGGVGLTEDVLLERNHIHHNGSLAEYYEHNVYNEVSGVTYQFNRFGPPRGGKNGPLGANIKERSAGVVIRYNWIEDGAHVLDIVDAQEAMASTVRMPSFHATFVYGNVILRGRASGSMIHYGGDSGEFKNYRKGTLHFYNNTVVVKNDDYADYQSAAVFELSTQDEHLEAKNNVFWSTVTPTALRPVGLLGSRDQVTSGVARLSRNWLATGWTPLDLTPGATVAVKAEITGVEGSVRGASPGFVDAHADDYRLAPASALRGGGQALGQDDLPLAFQYIRHQNGAPRRDGAKPTLGALAD